MAEQQASPFSILESSLPAAEPLLVSLLPKVRGFVASRVSHAADAEDLSQEILLRIHQGVRRLSDETRIHGWVWQVARNAVIDHYRRRNEPARGLDDIDTPAPDAVAPALDDVVASWLGPMIDELPETYRDAVRMSEMEDLPLAEVAARLSISLSRAKSRVQRGRIKLREALLACCQLEFDRDGRIVSYHRRGDDCPPGGC
jgi:RNA polymerase sigma-70 factor, ECF subfamily